MQPESSSSRAGTSSTIRSRTSSVRSWPGSPISSTALTVARERRVLMQLDDRMLKDIGIGRSEAYREASKPFGDVSNRRLNLY